MTAMMPLATHSHRSRLSRMRPDFAAKYTITALARTKTSVMPTPSAIIGSTGPTTLKYPPLPETVHSQNCDGPKKTAVAIRTAAVEMAARAIAFHPNGLSNHATGSAVVSAVCLHNVASVRHTPDA